MKKSFAASQRKFSAGRHMNQSIPAGMITKAGAYTVQNSEKMEGMCACQNIDGLLPIFMST
jgi:hypothetical protein